ncbi:glycosyltransferase [Dyella sp. 20L07]|uniref:glycosyltransferase n=1 Tax=Dyella sp. 20L07 TaxID=3384240 RepID=UPI003D27F0DE
MASNDVVGLLLNYRDAVRSVACIDSLIAEGISRIVVWDNSEDAGVSAAQIREVYEDDSRISVEVSTHNLGFAAGVNHGLRICRQRHGAMSVLLINNDASLQKGALAILRDASREHPKARLISMDIHHGGRRQGPLHYQRWTGLQFNHPVPGSFPYPSGCCLWIHDPGTSLRLFDEGFFMYGEDCELGWRLSHQPSSWVHLSQPLVIHEGAASSGLGSSFYETQVVVAHFLLARKLASHRLDSVALLFVRVPVLMARATRRSLRYRSWVPWLALWRGMRIAREGRGL